MQPKKTHENTTKYRNALQIKKEKKKKNKQTKQTNKQNNANSINKGNVFQALVVVMLNYEQAAEFN